MNPITETEGSARLLSGTPQGLRHQGVTGGTCPPPMGAAGCMERIDFKRPSSPQPSGRDGTLVGPGRPDGLGQRPVVKQQLGRGARGVHLLSLELALTVCSLAPMHQAIRGTFLGNIGKPCQLPES